MKSLLEILRNTEEDGALAPLGASPGDHNRVATATWPERIYLQCCGEDETHLYGDTVEATWCADKIGDGDVPYTRADLAKPRSEAGGTSSLKDLATRNALIAVLKQCDLELERCEDEKCAVCLLAFCIQEIAEKAYYETVGEK